MKKQTNASDSIRVYEQQLSKVVDKLCSVDSYTDVYHIVKHHNIPMPSVQELAKTIELLKSVIFPGYFTNSDISESSMKYYTGSTLDRAMKMLMEQIKRGYCFYCVYEDECTNCEYTAFDTALTFMDKLPAIRELLASDALAAFEGDPAAKQIGETIFCYPSITALLHHRIAHELYKLNVPLIPRIISERAHSLTGIDIHPGASIGERFFMDHGTGTVIGETTIIGNNVRIYQGVTLGAKSFPLDEKGLPIKNIPRHPIVEDNVVIYAGATILGRITIGKNAEIGGNVWVTHDVEAGAKVVQQRSDS